MNEYITNRQSPNGGLGSCRLQTLEGTRPQSGSGRSATECPRLCARVLGSSSLSSESPGLHCFGYRCTGRYEQGSGPDSLASGWPWASSPTSCGTRFAHLQNGYNNSSQVLEDCCVLWGSHQTVKSSARFLKQDSSFGNGGGALTHVFNNIFCESSG